MYHGLLAGSIVFSHQFHRNKIHSHLLTNPSAFAMINVDKGEEEEEYIHSSFREGFSQAGRKPKDAWMEGSFGAGGQNEFCNRRYEISIRGQDSKLSRDPTLKGNEVCIRL